MKKNLLIALLLAFTFGVSAQRITTQKPKGIKKEAAVAVKNSPLADVKPVRMEAAGVKSVFDSPVKEVLSSKILKDGSDYRVVRLQNGLTKKQLLPKPGSALSKKIKPNDNPRIENLLSDDDGSLVESFEGWDGATLDWLPAGWTDESKTGSPVTTDMYGDPVNFTWKTTDDSGAFSTPAKDGHCYAHCQFAFPYTILSGSDEVLIIPPTSDEWLISPAVEVKADFSWKFYLHINPFWARFDYETFEFTALKTHIETLISEDNGATWTRLWNSDDFMLSFTDEELYETMGDFPWYYVKFDLSSYVGKTVKTAVRYIDDDGESAMVDMFTIGLLQPQAYYEVPEASFITGYSADYYELNADILQSFAYTPVQWNGYSIDADAVSWSFGAYGTFTEAQPLVTLPFDLIDPPVLTATSNVGSATYQWGTTYPYLFTGGTMGDIGVPEYHIGNYDKRFGFTRYSDINAEGMADYGTFKGVSNYFAKPASNYAIDTIFVHVGNLVAKAGEPVKLAVYKINDDSTLGDTLGIAEAYPEDFIFAFNSNGLDYYTVPFIFKALDPETMLESDTWLDINSPILVEFYNYESAYIFFQYEDNPDGYNYAYISFEEGVMPLSDFGIYTSALFDMTATLPFLYTEDNKYDAPVAGGSKSFDITTYWHPNGWWLDEELPDWITFGSLTLNQSTGVATLPVNVAALPSGVTGRSANIELASYACNLTLQVKQGDGEYLSVNTVISNQETVKAARQGDNFILSYPAKAGSVSVYTISGQKLSTYELNPKGVFTLPASNLAKGVYLLKFDGLNKSVKIVK